MDKQFRFDAATHTYYVDNVIVPSVTSCLPYNYHGNNTDAMLKGSYVHQMIELEANGLLDEETLDPQLKPYQEAYRRFSLDFKLTDKLAAGLSILDFKSGSPHPCTDLQLAGYSLLVHEGIDEEGNKFMDRQNKTAVEIKLYHPTYRFAGTIDLVIDGGNPQTICYAVYLKNTGKYRVEAMEGNLRHNQQMFLAFLQTHRFKKERGLL